MDSPTEFMTSRKKAGRTFLTAWRVLIESGVELPPNVKYDRWHKVLSPFITKVERWSVQADSHLPEFPNHDWAKIHPTVTYVVHTKYGTAVVVEFSSGSALQGITFNVGRKPQAFTMGTWRKYGSKRGWGMTYLLAAHGLDLCGSPAAGSDICELEAVCRLSQGGISDSDFAATRALYEAVEKAA